MNTEKNIQSVKENVQKIITVKNAKRLAALLVVCAIPLSGGAWYQHQQKATVKAEPEGPPDSCRFAAAAASVVQTAAGSFLPYPYLLEAYLAGHLDFASFPYDSYVA